MTLARLEHLAEVRVSNVDKHTVAGETPVRLCNYVDVYKNELVRDDMDFMAASAQPGQVARFGLRAGDTIITKDSETADDIGIPALVQSAGPDLVCGYHLALVRPHLNRVNPAYLAWAMRSRGVLSQWAVLATGVTRVGLKLHDLRRVQVPTHTLDEQRAIADFLDRETGKIDALIEKQTELITRLHERRVALVVRATTTGNEEAELVESGIYWAGRIPVNWGERPLKRIFTSVQAGVWGDEAKGDSNDISCIRVADFDRPRLRVGEAPTVRNVSRQDRHKCGVFRGDLLIEKSGGTGINPVGFVVGYDADVPAVCANFIARIRPRKDQLTRYWLYALFGSYASGLTWKSVKQTTGIQNLDMGAFFSEHFPVPSAAEQQRVVEYLDRETARIDELIGKTERMIELSRERRSALITAAVTGQIDVNEHGGAA